VTKPFAEHLLILSGRSTRGRGTDGREAEAMCGLLGPALSQALGNELCGQLVRRNVALGRLSREASSNLIGERDGEAYRRKPTSAIG
jgi:hypothetical protein